MDDPDLALPVTKPWTFFPSYEVELSDSEAERIGVTDPAQAEVLVTVRATGEAKDFSANLRAPIIMSGGRALPGHQRGRGRAGASAAVRTAGRLTGADSVETDGIQGGTAMLMMTRRAGQKIVIGDGITIEIVEVAGNTVRLGVDAPRSVPVYREEIWTAVRAENEAAATAATTATELPAAPPAPPAPGDGS